MPDERLYENLRLFFPDVSVCKGCGQIPEIKPIEQITVDRWIPFSAANSRKLNDSVGIHMFLHDFQFERLWNKPTQYIQMLQAAGAVCSPDFSMYTDTPTALNIYNHYRKHWLGAYWQMNGIKVIPTICWADRESFGWCFDGEPSESIVAVSSSQMNPMVESFFNPTYNTIETATEHGLPYYDGQHLTRYGYDT